MLSDGEYVRGTTGTQEALDRGTQRVLRGARPGSRASGAGVTWTSRTASAPWAARFGHTSVVDAAGAIYVIGGGNGSTGYQDVWASSDGGADRTLLGGGRGVLGGYSGY